ncbi:MAG: iron-sulfur cluster assembly scaffold protein [Deltaproteobacteria bacterium]|nr:iron-sulfur cluster assembly scaffold protein [Deltaproteobacteria bacterium]
MNDKIEDEFLEQLQAEIIEQARKVYSHKVIDRWLHPNNLRTIENPQGYGKMTGQCEDTIEIFLRIVKDRIVEATFLTDGCGTTLAAGSMVTELAQKKTIQEAFRISKDLILKELEGLPKESEHCAQLASNALKAALVDYLASKRESWKTPYHKR